MLNVFYAEDNESDILLFKLSFKKHFGKAEFIVRNTGDLALKFLLSPEIQELDLILLDENMPNLKGRDIINDLSKSSYAFKAPIVLYTTAQLTPEEVTGLNTLSAHYLQKPFQLDGYEDLMADLKQILKWGGLKT